MEPDSSRDVGTAVN